MCFSIYVNKKGVFMKINQITIAGNAQILKSKSINKKANNTTANNTINSLMSADATASLKAGISFKRLREEMTDFEKSLFREEDPMKIGKPSELRVPDLFNMPEDVHISLQDMNTKDEKAINPAGLNIVSKQDEDKKTINITNDKGDLIFTGEVKNGAKAPTLTYKQGKFMPEVTVKSPDILGKSVIKMLSGSKIEGENFKFIMPGDYKDFKNNEVKTVSFKGKTAITTLNLEPRTKEAVNKYMASEVRQNAIKGDYADDIQKYEPTIVIPAGGMGSRFQNLARPQVENKPSFQLPTDEGYRIIATALNMASSAGVIDKDDNKNTITYLSQKHDISGNDVKYVNKYDSDGGAVYEGLNKEYIDKNKDMIILNADIISNADITRAYHALKTLPNAALVIPYYSVDAERAKAFGLLGIEKDENDNIQLSSFVEKTPYTNKCPMPQEFSDDKEYDDAMSKHLNAQKALNPNNDGTFLINPGVYVMSKEANKVLEQMGINNPKETLLGKHVMPEIVKLCKEGKLLDENGNKMKAYTIPLERKGGEPAFWDDIGTAEAYLKTIKEIALETKNKGSGISNKFYGMPQQVLEDFKNNVDLDTSVVYQSEKSREKVENFKKEYNISTFEGNIFTT